MGNAPSTPLGSCLDSAIGSSLLALPNKPLYQLTDVKPYNLDISVAPVAITYPKTEDHVAAIIKCASSNGAKVQARSGGHSYGNHGESDGGGDKNTVVVDLKNFQQFTMDKDSWHAHIGAGNLLGDVTKKLLENGDRAMAHGTCPQVGIGGHATIGGLGPASRMWGSALDHVVSARVVLANSTIITASPTQYPDIFWALKGAGASFGIITEFEMITHPNPGEAIQYSYTFATRPFAKLASRFKKWQDMIADPGLSRKFASQVVLTEVGMIISGTYFGSRDEFNALNLTSVFPDATTSDALVFDDWAGLVGHWGEDIALQLGGGISSAFYSKSLAFTAKDLIPSTSIDEFFTYLDKVDKATPIWFGIFDLEGGATNDVALDATAYGHRDALFYFQSYGVNIGKLSKKTRDFVNGMDDVLVKGLGGKTLGAYAGYVDPALENAQERYWGGNLGRLREVKGRVDPGDVFHNPQSVPLP
ncbi:putative glucooligosaccharide oxidase [Tothia fuscella]|uniref:Glucooligosaccharide oxidase n=1 Tax=Tothia fuscella TaxID=1048955 RepID=A0A9P4TZL1_9PEZI|nr:putative glucooligosaccharide oxidase [Tothia fuscella]